MADVNFDIKSEKKKPHLITGGTFACSGCGAILGTKLTLVALGKNTILINTSGCMTLTATWPFTPYKVPWVHGAIENGGSVAAGILMGLKSQKKDKNVNIVVYAGDGATYDIGLQALSGMVHRKEKIIYICYNNCQFANTGHQCSAATQQYSRTSTTPPPIGNPLPRKNMAKMMALNGADYCATACVSFPFDFIKKLTRHTKSRKTNGRNWNVAFIRNRKQKNHTKLQTKNASSSKSTTNAGTIQTLKTRTSNTNTTRNS